MSRGCCCLPTLNLVLTSVLCLLACRGDMCGESYRLVLLGTRPIVSAQLHLQVQSHHSRGEKKTVPTRVPQCFPIGWHTAQVSTITHTGVKPQPDTGSSGFWLQVFRRLYWYWKKNCYQDMNLVSTAWHCPSLCSPWMRQRIDSSSHKDYCRRTAGRGVVRATMPREAEGSRDQAKACQDQRNQRKARIASSVLLMRHREREEGEEEREQREHG